MQIFLEPSDRSGVKLDWRNSATTVRNTRDLPLMAKLGVLLDENIETDLQTVFGKKVMVYTGCWPRDERQPRRVGH
jgi:hypothetical protein